MAGTLSHTNTLWLIGPWCRIALGVFELISFLPLMRKRKISIAALKFSHWCVRFWAGCKITGSCTYFWPLYVRCSQTSRLLDESEVFLQLPVLYRWKEQLSRDLGPGLPFKFLQSRQRKAKDAAEGMFSSEEPRLGAVGTVYSLGAE